MILTPVLLTVFANKIYNINSIVYNINSIVYNINFRVYNINFRVYNINFRVYNINSIVYNIKSVKLLILPSLNFPYNLYNVINHNPDVSM